MIINKNNLNYQTRSNQPRQNWLKDNEYVVIDDGSELAQKFIKNYPFVELIYDELKNVIDVKVLKEQKEATEKRQRTLGEIERLKQKLSDTDYQAIKYAEGQILEEEYAPIKAKRQVWRDEINKLEAELLKEGA